jgi:hypothetical protein
MRSVPDIGFSYEAARNTAPLLSPSICEVLLFESSIEVDIPVELKAILYPIPKVIPSLYGLLTRAQLWVAIVPPDNRGFILWLAA